jgi:hypothetical protein
MKRLWLWSLDGQTGGGSGVMDRLLPMTFRSE